MLVEKKNRASAENSGCQPATSVGRFQVLRNLSLKIKANCFSSVLTEDTSHASEATLCKQVQFPSWTAHVAPPKPAALHELMIKNKMKPNSLIYSGVHVLHTQKWSCSVLVGIR